LVLCLVPNAACFALTFATAVLMAAGSGDDEGAQGVKGVIVSGLRSQEQVEGRLLAVRCGLQRVGLALIDLGGTMAEGANGYGAVFVLTAHCCHYCYRYCCCCSCYHS